MSDGLCGAAFSVACKMIHGLPSRPAVGERRSWPVVKYSPCHEGVAPRAVPHVLKEICCPCRKSKFVYSAVHLLRSYNTLGLQDPRPCGSVSGSFAKHILRSLVRYK
jgi:hypothetical protein